VVVAPRDSLRWGAWWWVLSRAARAFASHFPIAPDSQAMHYSVMNVADLRKVAGPACREFGVRRLDVFGSAARGSASASSDVDLLVEFTAPDESPAKRFFGLLHGLEAVLGCDVDLLTTCSLRNPYFKARVLRERVPIYEG